MTDIFDNPILCNECNIKTRKTYVNKEGFTLRTLECPKCGKQWTHPLDLQDYENFNKIKNKQFQVKLRMVGNSYTVSIPREIIEFEEEFNREIAKIIHMSLEEPEKLTLFFSKKIRKFYQQ
jgi:transposase-like protein